MVERYRDEIKVWDVVNEAVLQAAVFRPSIWLKKLGPQYLEQAFRDAARYSRDAKLFYNDFDLAFNRKKLLATLWLLDSLREAGVRVDAIGFQMHLRPAAMPTAEQIRAAFALVKQRGYQLEVTELDVSLPLPVSDELLAQQAQVVCQVVLACLENGSCTGITFWGLTDAHSWIPHVLPGLGAATLFDPDYQQKPAWYGLEAALTTKSCRQVNSSSFF